jgi:hypothetical protein
MGKMIKPIGHGLLAAGVLLVALYLFGVYLRGPEAFRDALDPFSEKTYLPLLPLLPGALLLWLAERPSSLRRFENRRTLDHSAAPAFPQLSLEELQ